MQRRAPMRSHLRSDADAAQTARWRHLRQNEVTCWGETCKHSRHSYYPCRRVFLSLYFPCSSYCPPAGLTVSAAHPCLRWHVFTACPASCRLLALYLFIYLFCLLLNVWKEAGVGKLWWRKAANNSLKTLFIIYLFIYLFPMPWEGTSTLPGKNQISNHHSCFVDLPGHDFSQKHLFLLLFLSFSYNCFKDMDLNPLQGTRATQYWWKGSSIIVQAGTRFRTWTQISGRVDFIGFTKDP